MLPGSGRFGIEKAVVRRVERARDAASGKRDPKMSEGSPRRSRDKFHASSDHAPGTVTGASFGARPPHLLRATDRVMGRAQPWPRAHPASCWPISREEVAAG